MARTRTAARKRAWIIGIAVLAAVAVAALSAFRGPSDDTTSASLSASDASLVQPSLEASAVTLAVAPALRSDAAVTGEPDSTGASSDDASIEDAAPAGGASPAGVVPPTDLGTVPAGAMSRLDVRLEVPQTYRCTVRVLGWQNPEGVVALHVDTAELLGEIDPATGEPTGEPSDTDVDNAERLRGLDVLASTAAHAGTLLRVDETATVYLVLLPSGEGSTMFVDKVK